MRYASQASLPVFNNVYYAARYNRQRKRTTKKQERENTLQGKIAQEVAQAI